MEILKEGEYIVPDELVVHHYRGRIEVTKRIDRRLDKEDIRCRDCKHFVRGRAKSKDYLTDVCEEKPKETEGFFYSVSPYGKVCAKFERSEKGGGE